MEKLNLAKKPLIMLELAASKRNLPLLQWFSESDSGLILCGMNKNTPYYIVDYNRKVVFRVSKPEFQSRSGPVVVVGKCKFKLLNGVRHQVLELLRTVRWESQGLFSSVRNIFSYSLSTISGLSEGIQILSNNKTIPPLLLDLFSIYVTSVTPTYSNWTPTYLVGFLARIASVVMRVKDLPFRSESIDAVVLATLAFGMPKAIVDALRNMSLLTSKRILDTPNVIFSIISQISHLFIQLLEWLPGIPDNYREAGRKLLSLGVKYDYVAKVKFFTEAWSKDKRVMMDKEFRERVKDIYNKVESDDISLEYMKSGPATTRIRWETFCRLFKSVGSYESCSRKEPVCVVLEGPPGCRKTVASVKLTEVLGMSTYVHIVKTVDDGKDFYDGYNNEEIFVMDDVGQQGPSQWRSVINMVSTLKLPLECANVDLKDTKYFDSEVMLLTTNQFMDINFVRSDCISDKEALHRRGHVFRYERNRCVYYRFDLRKHTFISKHPDGMKVKLPLSCDLSAGPDASMDALIPWLTAWVKVLRKHYSDIYARVGCSDASRVAYSQQADALITLHQDEFEDAFGAESLWENLSTSCVEGCAEALNFVAFAAGRLTGALAQLVGNVTDAASNAPQWVGYLLLSSMTAAGLGYLSYLWNKTDDEENTVGGWRAALAKTHRTPVKVSDGVVMFAEETKSTMLDAVRRHMAVIKFYRDDGTQPLTQCLVSGHFVIVPAHVLHDVKPECTIYSSFDSVTNDWRVLDMVPYKVEFLDNEQDIALLTLPKDMLTPFKKASQYFKKFNDRVARPHMVTCDGAVDLTSSVSVHPTSISYKQVNTSIVRTIMNPMVYGISCPGLCGALIVDPDVGVMGMHLTGNGVTGAARIFSQSLLDKIRNLLEGDANFAPVNRVDKAKKDFSGILCQSPYTHTPQSKTHIVPSPLYDMATPTKFPANLSATGLTTVRDRAQRYYKPQMVLSTDELSFARSVFEVLVPCFSSIPEVEVVKGNGKLPSMNKKSVNGFFLPMNKEYYLDYESGSMRPEFAKEMEAFRNRVLTRQVKMEDVMMYEAIKDELRVEGKVDKPRTFTIDNLLAQFEMKRLMGSLFTQVVEDKWYNQVMIGINPYKDWDMLFQSMQKCELKWDADLGEWDAKQMAQMQDTFHSVIVDKFRGSEEDRKILRFLLENSVRSWALVQNTLYLGTHGMKSGKWITALFNSFYNRGYTAVWYYRMMLMNKSKPTVTQFITKVRDYVLGDDKLVGVDKELAHLRYPLNAKSMQEFFTSIGMTFTDGSKNNTVKDKEAIDLTFLKRGFRYHTQLGIVGPLSMETLCNSLLWVDSTKDLDVVMEGKLLAYQREIFLHERKDLVDKLEEECDRRGIYFPRLPEACLLHLFSNEPDYAYTMYIRDKGLLEGVL